jgi:phosphopantothenoylcysteine decarboxylase/phosphopantothenate--cysteine ligase
MPIFVRENLIFGTGSERLREWKPEGSLDQSEMFYRSAILVTVCAMKCIVTAGPTYEELDQVRRLTNFSTGALGTALANHLSRAGHSVTLLRGYYSICDLKPEVSRVHVFTTTEDLEDQLARLAFKGPGAVFHAAAVSDFRFGKVWRRLANGKLREVRSGKFSTRDGTLLSELVPTPKLLGKMREWYPRALLVGWKYEVDGGRTGAVRAARRQIEENRTNACVVNGPAYGSGYGLQLPGIPAKHCATQSALFGALVKQLQKGTAR